MAREARAREQGARELPPCLDLGRPADWQPVEVVDPTTLEVLVAPVERVPTTDAVLVARAPDGTPRAVEARCPHRGRPLDTYAREGSRPGLLACSAHGYEFDVTSGRCVNGAGSQEAPERLVVWEVAVQADGNATARRGRGEPA